jgi:hypothetical protein
METLQEKKLMEKFLKLNYPIYRLKHQMRFKRTIIFDTGESFLLSDKQQVNALYVRLFDLISLVFCSDRQLIRTVLRDFLNLRESSNTNILS